MERQGSESWSAIECGVTQGGVVCVDSGAVRYSRLEKGKTEEDEGNYGRRWWCKGGVKWGWHSMFEIGRVQGMRWS